MKRALVLAVHWLLTVSLVSVALADGVAERTEVLLDLYHEQGRFDGSVCVVQNGKMIFGRGYGKASVEWNARNGLDTKFEIASMTKPFTATLIMQLVERGLLRLDDRLTDVLPDYRKDTGDRIRIQDLLVHSSGLEDLGNDREFWTHHIRNDFTRREYVDKFCSGDLRFPPGTQAEYCSVGYYLLGVIVEKVTRRSYEAVLHERILQPLGMASTGVYRNEPIYRNMASGYVRTFLGRERAEYDQPFNHLGQGDIYSTATDLSKWALAFDDDAVLTSESRKAMFRPYLQSTNDAHLSHGLGWRLWNENNEFGIRAFEHGGNTFGFRSIMTIFPHEKNAIILLSNNGSGRYSREIYDIRDQLIRVLYGKPYEMPRRQLATWVGHTIAREGIEAALAVARKHRGGDQVEASESDMNVLGYQLLSRGMLGEARAILELNLEWYPESANAFDSFAECLFLQGDLEAASENYRESLRRDPENRNAERMLGRIEEEVRLRDGM